MPNDHPQRGQVRVFSATGNQLVKDAHLGFILFAENETGVKVSTVEKVCLNMI